MPLLRVPYVISLSILPPSPSASPCRPPTAASDSLDGTGTGTHFSCPGSAQNTAS